MTQTFTITSPVDDSAYVQCTYASDTDIAAALRASVAAQAQWRQTPMTERAKLCLRLVDALLEQKDRCSEELSWQMGRPIRYIPGELNGFAERARYMISVAEQSLQDLVFDDQPGFQRFIRRDPLGVVLAMVPWN